VTTFTRLNDGWNAEPNAPSPEIRVEGMDVVVSFLVNPFQYPSFGPDDCGHLRFRDCQRYRLGPTNDEGWYSGQCRFSRTAPAWGEFYEVSGDLKDEQVPGGWIDGPAQSGPVTRRFLFYFRDDTFECDAADWSIEFERHASPRAAEQ
jgi:hypothetical protein